jgi:hypothetical protein
MFVRGGLAAALSAIPSLALAAGEKAEDLIVVADTRVLAGGLADIHRYFGNLYNEDMMMFAVWSVVLTTALGAVLGVLMDIIMHFTGIDLTKRSIVEH